MARTNAGFTLSEILIGMGLLAVLLTAFIGILTGTFAMQEGGEEDVTAANLARTVVNEWKSRPYSEVEALISTPPAPVTRQVDGRDYNLSVNVERLAPPALNPGNEVLVITVTTNWTERTSISNGAGRLERGANLVLSSVVSKGGNL